MDMDGDTDAGNGTPSPNNQIQSREQFTETLVEKEGNLAKQTTKTTITETTEEPDRIVTRVQRHTVITKKQVVPAYPGEEDEEVDDSAPGDRFSQNTNGVLSNDQPTPSNQQADHLPADAKRLPPLDQSFSELDNAGPLEELQQQSNIVLDTPDNVQPEYLDYDKPQEPSTVVTPSAPEITVEAASDDSQTDPEPEVDLSPEEFDALVSAAKTEQQDAVEEVAADDVEVEDLEIDRNSDQNSAEQEERGKDVDPAVQGTENKVEDDEQLVEDKQNQANNEEQDSEDVLTKERLQPVIEETPEVETEQSQPLQEPQSPEEAKERVTQERAIDVAGVPEVVANKDKVQVEEKEEGKKETTEAGDTTPKAKHKKKGFFSLFKRKSKHKNSESDGETTPATPEINNKTTPQTTPQTTPIHPAEFSAVVTPPSRDRSPPKSVESSPVLTTKQESNSDTPTSAAETPNPSVETPLETPEQTPTKTKPEDTDSTTIERTELPRAEDEEDTLPELGHGTPEPSKVQSPDVVSLAESEVECTMTPPVTLTAAQPTPFTRAGLLQSQQVEDAEARAEEPENHVTEVVAQPADEEVQASSSRHVDNHFVVVAIDFGTTFSGYAFAFTRQPDSVHMMRKWEGGDPGVVNQKTPTCLLLTPEGEFKAFGFTARDMYHDLDAVEATRWLYFEKFKMMLHYEADLNKNTMVTAANGVSMSALTVFSHSLKFFKEHALQELSDQSSTAIINEDVRWVLTVPAIWKAPAKQFMRQASYNAGLASPEYPEQLFIALEPEAGSIYVRRLRLYQLVPEKPQRKALTLNRECTPPVNNGNMNKISDELTTGTRYMLVDCGGGTVDITVHEMEEHGHLKELYKASGGPYGSVGIELEFERLLVAIFSQEFIDSFRSKRPAGWVDLMIAFESRKRAATPYKNNALNVSLPFSFIDYYKKKKGSAVEAAIRKYGDKDIRWSSQGMLRLMPAAMLRLFMPTMERIQQAIGDVLNNPAVKGIEFLFLVGGFAESQILQLHLRTEFSDLMKVIIPQDVSLTILKGAVCYGLDPTVVTLRWSRLTYGVGVLNRFVHGKHPEEKLVKKDGVEWCTDVFDKYVVINEPVGLGDTVLRSYTPAKAGQKASIINVYAADSPDAGFISDVGVRRVGSLCLDLSQAAYEDRSERREIQTRMTFGDTEIKVSTLDVATDKVVRCTIDFLNK